MPLKKEEKMLTNFTKPVKIFPKINKTDYVILVGDLNARVGNPLIKKAIGNLEKQLQILTTIY
jgi:hypothetical protein